MNQRRRIKPQRGSSMAWFAVVTAFLLLPLFLLVIDGARVLYAERQLQHAADAACQALTEYLLEQQAAQFKKTGQVRLNGNIRQAAIQQAFLHFRTMVDRDPVLRIAPGEGRSAMTTLFVHVPPGGSAQNVSCQASAAVEVIFLGGYRNPHEGLVYIQVNAHPDAQGRTR